MSELLLSSVGYGGYVSPIKLALYAVLFFLWLPVVSWVYKDAEAVGTKQVFWTTIVFGVWAAGSIIWLLVPVFVIGLLLYLIAAGGASLSYVMHRNSLVPEFQRVLTAEHIRGLFSSEKKKLDELEDLTFITANNNEVPVPEPKTPDYFGYKAAFDLLSDAMWRRAYDIVLSPTPENYKVVYFVDGAGLKQPGIARGQIEYLGRFLKHLADLDVDEKRKPQKGSFTIFRDEKRTDWEVSSAGSTAGEQIRIKQLGQQSLTKLEELGLTEQQHQQLAALAGAKQGLFIVSGPKTSGVTTTFYSLLRSHDAFLNSIITLEKQPSAKLQNITQNVFRLSDSGVTTYGKKLQEVVRTDPDIVGVADCEDAEAAKTACKTAAGGKLVYVTIEADNVLKALAKWIKMVGDKDRAVASLLGITNQRLLRILCDSCKQAYEPKQELLRKFNIPPEKAKVLYRTGKVVYDKRGKPSPCDDCQETGFLGRTSVFETIMINKDLRQAIIKAKSLSDISTEFRRAKMLYLQEQAMRRVVNGETSINEMIRVLSPPKERAVRGKSEQAR